MNTPASIANHDLSASGFHKPSGAARRGLARLGAVATSIVVLAVLVLGDSSTALAGGAYFVPEDTEAHWDGAVATVAFREAEVELAGDQTTISVKVTADVDVVCTRAGATARIRRSATALDVTNYPIDDGVVVGTATLPLEVRGLIVPGYSCVTEHVWVTAVLEDFWTGATLTHTT